MMWGQGLWCAWFERPHATCNIMGEGCRLPWLAYFLGLLCMKVGVIEYVDVYVGPVKKD